MTSCKNTWMGEVQGIAGTAKVLVVAAVFGDEPVVGGVVEALERERRSQVVALGGVVVDHVEDYFEARGVQALSPST